jgi:hypothetical protein
MPGISKTQWKNRGHYKSAYAADTGRAAGQESSRVTPVWFSEREIGYMDIQGLSADKAEFHGYLPFKRGDHRILIVKSLPVERAQPAASPDEQPL